MKRSIIYKWYPKTFLIASACLLGTACQKSFDPASYAPEQTFNGFAASSEVAAENLVAYWSFDGNLEDSVSGTSGTNTGTGFTTGIKGQALQGGLNDYVLFTNTPQIKTIQSFTLAFWVNTAENTAGIQTPIDFVNPVQFWGNFDNFFDAQTETGAEFHMHLFGDGANGEAWLTSWKLSNPWGVWLNLALTYDLPSENFTFYVNGLKVGSAVKAGFGIPDLIQSPSIVFGTMQFNTVPSSTTGGDAQSWASYLTGALDEVRMYDKALPAEDLKALYQLQNLAK